MRNLIKHCFVALFIICSLGVNAQSLLGEVATVYVTTTNLDSSAAFYSKLGFNKVASNTYPTPWAQVSDGSLLIMMRQDDKPFMGLTYYSQDLEKIAASLESAGIRFDKKPEAGNPIKRYHIRTPDNFNIVLSNNLGGFRQPTGTTMINMPPGDFTNSEKYPNQQCGVFGEFCHPVKNIDSAEAFWKKLGFTVKARMKEPYPHSILTDGLMIVGLHQTNHFSYPAIAYFGMNSDERIEKLKANGITRVTEVAGKANVVLITWEGQHFFVFSLGM